MDPRASSERRAAREVAVVAALVATHGALGAWSHLAAGAGTAWTHFGYLPIAVASVWWGRRGLVVAGLVAAVTLGFGALGAAGATLWGDAVRAACFLAAAGAVGMLSERARRAPAPARGSEELYRWQIEASFVGIFAWRGDRILFANPRFGQMLGYGPEELVGRVVWDLVCEADRSSVRERVRQRRAEGTPRLHYECRFVHRDGSMVWADVASSATTYRGEPAVLVNASDITDRKLAEGKQRELAELARRQEEQLVHSTRLAELGEMAAAIAHELNQPLTGIRNFARNALFMLDEHAGSEDDVRENLRLISAQVDRAAKIIGRMRQLTRKSDRHLAAVSINHIVRDSVEFLMPQLELSGVEVSLDLADPLPDVQGDRIRLEQVVLNLLTNARQAMGESERRRLAVRTRREADGPTPLVVLEVEDTGKGFRPDEADRLFTPFYTTKKLGHGTGLGLSISLSIVTDHGGTIEAHGSPGAGARFVVRLPESSNGAQEGGAS